MCTVTFIASEGKFYLTSNRDEKTTRLPALTPQQYEMESATLLFPKDANAGGTWVALKQNGDAAVLLNGGLYPHTPQPPYRLSRGLVLIEILQNEQPYHCFQLYDCCQIEPFTLILFCNLALYECRWDGIQKHVKQLDVCQPYIWSSVTLYSPEIVGKRKQWFDDWIKQTDMPQQDEIFHFHRFTGEGDSANDLFMNRNNETRTVSITSISIDKGECEMQYWDALDDSIHHSTFHVTSETTLENL